MQKRSNSCEFNRIQEKLVEELAKVRNWLLWKMAKMESILFGSRRIEEF